MKAVNVKLPENLEMKIMRDVKRLFKNMNLLKDKKLDYLTNFEIKTRNFFMDFLKCIKLMILKSLLKIRIRHIFLLLNSWILKLRPIAVGPAWPTHRLSNYVDILLKNIIM